MDIKIQNFKEYIKDSIYIVSCAIYTGAFVSKNESLDTAEYYKKIVPEVFWFKSHVDNLGEFLTEDEIQVFCEKHENYLKMVKINPNEKNTI